MISILALGLIAMKANADLRLPGLTDSTKFRSEISSTNPKTIGIDYGQPNRSGTFPKSYSIDFKSPEEARLFKRLLNQARSTPVEITGLCDAAQVYYGCSASIASEVSVKIGGGLRVPWGQFYKTNLKNVPQVSSVERRFNFQRTGSGTSRFSIGENTISRHGFNRETGAPEEIPNSTSAASRVEFLDATRSKPMFRVQIVTDAGPNYPQLISFEDKNSAQEFVDRLNFKYTSPIHIIIPHCSNPSFYCNGGSYAKDVRIQDITTREIFSLRQYLNFRVGEKHSNKIN